MISLEKWSAIVCRKHFESEKWKEANWGYFSSFWGKAQEEEEEKDLVLTKEEIDEAYKELVNQFGMESEEQK